MISHHGDTSTDPPLATTRFAAKTITRNPTPARARPIANLAGLERSMLRLASRIQSAANSGDKRMMNAEFTD